MSKILIVDDDAAGARTLQLHLSGQGHEVTVGHSVEEGLAAARSQPPELLIMDIRMPGRSGLEGLHDFRQGFPGIHVIMITAFHDMESTIEAMQKGAEDYIHKPIDIDELDTAIAKILRNAQPGEQMAVGAAVQESAGALTMVGRSRAMKEVFKTIGLVAKSPATVLITGESGTGKELVARAVHRAGEHPDGPFVVINCAALVETLLESDMFGHERGAFTGAVSRQAGKFALARGGTVFLDEIGELSPAMQAKLLRVLQYKEFMPLGAKQVEYTDARIVAATNVDLGQRVREGLFREDLYYRLQVVNVHLPPLRERMEDLPDLVQTLLGRINRELGSKVTHIASEVLDALCAYGWPGNVRELENMLMKAVALCPGNTLTLDLLPGELDRAVPPVAGEGSAASNIEQSQLSLADMERLHVARVLAAQGWHKGRACEVLGVSRPRLRRMIKEYGLEPPEGMGEGED
jgi:DNA-binding NtrC family response regulator